MSAADLMARIDAARGDHQRASDLLAEARDRYEPPEPPPPPPNEGIDISSIAHTALDFAGFIPGVGVVADLANAALYAAEGDYVNAGLSAAAAVPFVGDAAAAAKIGITAAGGIQAAAMIAGRGSKLPNQADALINNGRKVSGKFPDTAGSDEVLYRVGSNGRVSYYQVYDPDGLPIKRVDINPASRIHAGIPTPHAVDYIHNKNPATGQVFPAPGNTRSARPDEIPNIN